MATNQRALQKGFSKLGFILAAAGSAVGLGNLWRFPWQVGKYGGFAFVFTYIIMVLVLGMSIMMAEIFLGRYSKTTVVDSYGKINKWFKIIGLLAVFVPFLITCYYTVIGGWSVNYALNYIFEPDFVAKAGGSGDYFGSFITSTYRAPFFGVLFMFLTILIVARGVERGIEKASRILFPLLLLMVFVLAIISLSNSNQEGVREGLKFYLGHLDFKKLGTDGLIAAMSQAFFSLSLGMGAMVAYGAYTGKKMNLGKSALTVCGLDTLFALVAGLIIFPTVFANAESTAIAEELVSKPGAGLVFVVIPQLLQGKSFLGFVFFMLVAFAAITSLISLLEVVSQFTIKHYKMSRKQATWFFGSIACVISIFVSLSMSGERYTLFKFDLLTYFDEMTNTVLLPVVGLFSAISVSWALKKETVFKALKDDNCDFKKDATRNLWYYNLKFISPALCLIVLITGVKGNFESYAKSGNNYGFVLLGTTVLLVFAVIVTILINNNKYIAWRNQRNELRIAQAQLDTVGSTMLNEVENDAEKEDEEDDAE